MARADLLTNLIRAERDGDHAAFRRSVESLIADERSKNHHVLAERLVALLNDAPICAKTAVPAGWDNRIQQLAHQVDPSRRLADLILPSLLATKNNLSLALRDRGLRAGSAEG